MQRECVFDVFSIENTKDSEAYKKTLSKFKLHNPFNNEQLMQAISCSKGVLKYFTFSIKQTPIIVMPFFYRNIKIKNNNTSHFDVTSPYGYSGPFYDKKNEQYLPLFWKTVDNWYKENNVVSEFIRFNLSHNYKYYTGELSPALINVKGKIIDPEKLWDIFKAKVRNNYRKAVKDELEYKIYYDEIDKKTIDDFYNIYISTMKRNSANNQYYYKKDYFMNIALGNKKKCAIAMIYKNNVSISTEFILLSNDTAFSYLGGTLAEYFNSRPNDFLKFNTIKWLYDLNIKYYVLGGGRKNRDGLFNYKKSFFANDDDVIYYTGQKIIDHDSYNKLCKLTYEEYNLDENKTKDITFFPSYRINEVLVTEK